MKKLTTIFFILTASCLPLFAQTNFIIAGQTDGMIVTVFNSYGIIGPIQVINNYDSEGYATLDINHDGLNDFFLKLSEFRSLGGYGTTYSIIPLNGNFIKTTMERYHVYSGISRDSSLHVVAKKYFYGDTLHKALHDTSWVNSQTVIQKEGFAAGNWNVVLTNYITPIVSPYYYFLKIITDTDTLLGYLHFSTENKIFSYAIQGQDTTIVINSVVDDKKAQSLLIFPNPFTNTIVISSEKLYDYQITDYIGNILLSGKSNQPINTESLSAGSYILLLKNEDFFISRKIVKGK